MSTKNVTMPLREFPQSIAAEAAELLCVRAFYHFENRAIYEALLRDELITMGKMEDVGVEYIAKVMDSIPSSANAIYYAKIVREKYQLRKLIAACKDICDSAFE